MKAIYTLVPAALLIAFIACKTHFKTEKMNYPVDMTVMQVQLGKKLTMSICGPCHYDPATRQLTGLKMHDLPPISGRVYSRNLTQDAEKGIGYYTDGELAYLIRTGIARDGHLMPYMQRPNMADSDLQAIIAFLHSSDTLVKPSKAEPPETNYTAFGKYGINHYPGPLPYPKATIIKPDVNDKIAYGRYLVDNLSCYHCHSASFLSVDELQPEKSKGYMGGGNKMKDSEDHVIYSSNLTFDATGLQGWTEADFSNALKEGIAKGGGHLHQPMPRYPMLNEQDIASIFAYLQTVPKINKPVKRY